MPLEHFIATLIVLDHFLVYTRTYKEELTLSLQVCYATVWTGFAAHGWELLHADGNCCMLLESFHEAPDGGINMADHVEDVESGEGEEAEYLLLLSPQCHAPNRFGTVDIGIISPAFRKLKSFFKNIFIGLKHLELRKRKIADVIPCAGYNEFKKDSDANDMTVQQYYCEMYNIHIK